MNCIRMRFRIGYRLLHSFLKVLLCILVLAVLPCPAMAQGETTADGGPSSAADKKTEVAEQIKVQPIANDQAIEQRLTNILEATGWFSEIAVQVDEGVVFLDGTSSSEDYRTWAGKVAGKVSDVVAVVNSIEVIAGSPWDFSPVVLELRDIWRGVLQSLPRFGGAAIVLLLFVFISKVSIIVLRRVLEQRLNPLLRDVAARITSILVFLVGVYLAFQVAGLSWLSATVLGGTGIAGLVAGIAFRDLLENYLASILISIRNPFRIGDLVEISSHLGIVERVTTRGTVLMNQDGNHVQIPNSIVYKSIIRNFTANPNRREIFDVGIGYDSKASHAQEIALKVLSDHPAVLSEPEFLVLVDGLGSATVNLKVYFWYDGSKYNGLKVKSSLIRLVKRSFEKEGISMPDEAREILFPEGVPVHMVERASERLVEEAPEKKSAPPVIREEVTTKAEGRLVSEEIQLMDQARSSRVPEEGESLLKEQV